MFMKKILSLLTLLVLIGCFCYLPTVSVYALEDLVTIEKDYQDYHIDGPKVVNINDNVQYVLYKGNTEVKDTVMWKVSDSSIAEVDSNGNLLIHAIGCIDISAYIDEEELLIAQFRVEILTDSQLEEDDSHKSLAEDSKQENYEEIPDFDLNPINNVDYRNQWVFLNSDWYYFDLNGNKVTGWLYIDNIWYYLDTEGKMLTGFQDIAGQRYYFNSSGYMLTGWQQIDGKYYYFDASGAMAKDTWIGEYYVDENGIWDTNKFKPQWILNSTGWWYRHEDGSYTTSDFEVINGQTYYFNAAGYMVTGWQQVDDTWYYFDGSGAMKTGWVYVGNIWYYLDNEGKMLTGFQDIAGQRYYFNDAGYMLTGWQLIEGKYYYFDASGAMAKDTWIGEYYVDENGIWDTNKFKPQWILNSTGWWYRHEDGSYTTNDFEVINGQTYYFNAAGYMVTGWQLVDDTWYYFDGSGAMKTGWIYVGNIWYYLDTEGKMLTGFQDIAGQRYYFNDAGYMLTGWIQDGKDWYYASSSGAFSTGWQYIGNVWYYLDPNNNGLMLSDVKQSIDNTTYFFGQSGQMLTGWVNRPEGWYYAETSGAMHTGWLKLSSGKYYLDPNDSTNPGIMVHDEERVIDGKTYKFLSDGRIYTGFVTKDEGTYLINEDGDIVKGWGLYQGYWYYFSPDGTEHPGVMLTNQWLNLNDGTYYLSSDGKMKTGWILDNGSWYYATERGSIVKNGFGTISAKDAGGISRVSYFEVDGKLRMYSFTIGRVNYTVDGSGYITNTTVNGVPYYNQRDPQWAWTVIGSGNMQNTACAVMVATSIVNYYTNLNVNPVDMGKLFYQNGVYNAGGLDGTSADCWEIVKNQYGLNYTSNLSYEDLINNLRMGKIVATSENPGHFTVPGFTHAILLYGIDANGYVNVYDPYDTSKNGKYHISMIWNQQSTAYEDCINGGPFFAF